MVTQPQFDFAELLSPSDGLAVFRAGSESTGKYGYISR